MALVTMRDVGFTYLYADEPALSGVDLTLEPGLVYGVVGRNASGKSTLCNVIRGIVPHFHKGELTGAIEVLGTRLADWDPAALSQQIGYVFQNPFTQISGIRDTVFEEIALGLENLGLGRDEIIERVTEVVRRVGIEELIAKNPNGLSGGQRQKVAFASILAMDAAFLVIDEPTSQLDPESSEAIFAIIRDLKERGTSIVLVEHKIDLIAEYADRVIVLDRGAVIAEGPTAQILASAALDEAGVPHPEIARVALALADRGRALPEVPVTRERAHDLIAARLDARKESADAHRTE